MPGGGGGPPAGVVEADQRGLGEADRCFRLDQDVADPAIARRPAAKVERPQPLERPSVGVDVVVAEQLVAAADGEDRHPGSQGALQRAALVLGEVGEDAALVAVLAAAHEEEVAALEVGGSRPAGPPPDPDAPPLRAAAPPSPRAPLPLDRPSP